MTGRKQFVAIPSSQMITLSAESYSQVLAEGKLSSNNYFMNTVEKVGKLPSTKGSCRFARMRMV
jgi:hypothetical protein